MKQLNCFQFQTILFAHMPPHMCKTLGYNIHLTSIQNWPPDEEFTKKISNLKGRKIKYTGKQCNVKYNMNQQNCNAYV